MRETLWSLGTVGFLIAAWGLAQFGHAAGTEIPLYLASGFSLAMAILPWAVAGISRVYQQTGLQGIVHLSALVLAILTMVGALAGADGKDRESLFINFFVGLIGFATGVGYRRLPIFSPSVEGGQNEDD